MFKVNNKDTRTTLLASCRDVFRTQAKIYDEEFLQKLLLAVNYLGKKSPS